MFVDEAIGVVYSNQVYDGGILGGICPLQALEMVLKALGGVWWWERTWKRKKVVNEVDARRLSRRRNVRASRATIGDLPFSARRSRLSLQMPFTLMECVCVHIKITTDTATCL